LTYQGVYETLKYHSSGIIVSKLKVTEITEVIENAKKIKILRQMSIFCPPTETKICREQFQSYSAHEITTFFLTGQLNHLEGLHLSQEQFSGLDDKIAIGLVSSGIVAGNLRFAQS
jgi:hypothetical protein